MSDPTSTPVGAVRWDEDEPPPKITDPGTVNVADPASVKAAQRRGKRREDDATLFWRTVLADPIGRREMWQILQSGGAFDQRYGVTANGSPEPIETQRQEGEQRFSFRLYLSWLRLDPEGMAQMMREHHPALLTDKKR